MVITLPLRVSLFREGEQWFRTVADIESSVGKELMFSPLECDHLYDSPESLSLRFRKGASLLLLLLPDTTVTSLSFPQASLHWGFRGGRWLMAESWLNEPWMRRW